MGSAASVGVDMTTAENAGEEGAELLIMQICAPVVLRKSPKTVTEWVGLDALSVEDKAKFAGGTNATDMTSWDYDIWALNDDDLQQLVGVVFTSMDLHTKVGVKAATVGRWLRAVEALMNRNNNDYHCFHHVIDVMHSTFLFLTTFGAGRYLSDTEQFSLVTAAVCHDLDHPGTNNTYHVNKHTPLAIVYNDTSILENYHCARTFELFSQADYDVLDCLDKSQRKEARRVIMLAIMATDMVLHFGMKANLDKLATKWVETPLATDALPEPKERDLLMQVTLHAADVSNPSKQWDVCKRWSDHVIAEFFAQGDLEKAEDLPVSMNCDRDTTFQDELSMNFSDFIVGPFYMSITNLLPKSVPATENLKTNRDAWFSMYKTRVDADNADDALKEKLVGWNGRAAGTTAQFDACIDAARAKL
jgi:hypothetical protein